MPDSIPEAVRTIITNNISIVPAGSMKSDRIKLIILYLAVDNRNLKMKMTGDIKIIMEEEVVCHFGNGSKT